MIANANARFTTQKQGRWDVDVGQSMTSVV